MMLGGLGAGLRMELGLSVAQSPQATLPDPLELIDDTKKKSVA